MHRPTDPTSSPIRARIHERALSRVTKLFNAGLGDICAELFQNARRAGAGRIDVTVERIPAQFEGDRLVTVTDDGAGIADPAVLLSFGESGWDAGTAEREDAAGMGLLSLARRGCVVRSRVHAGATEPAPGWRMPLTPDHFLGCDDAQAVPDDAAPSPRGTVIAFVAHETAEAIQAAVAGAARYAPLPVTFDAEAVPQESFLDGACHTERWAGLTVGVFRNRHDSFIRPDLNFHGLTLNVRLPRIQTLDGDTWSARAEVESCPELELVLPARKEAVETPFLATLREAVREPIHHALAVADPTPRVAFEDHRDAARAGIPLPVPPAELRPWRPATADVDDWREAMPFTPVADDALVMAYDPDPPGGPGIVPGRRTGGAAPTPVRGRQAPGRLSLVRRAHAGRESARGDHHGRRRPLARYAAVDLAARGGFTVRPGHADASPGDPDAPATGARGQTAGADVDSGRCRLSGRGLHLGRRCAPACDRGQRHRARDPGPVVARRVFLPVR